LSFPAVQAREIRFTVSREQSGQRLDVFLAHNDASFSRSQIKRIVEEGNVLVNGILPKPSQLLKEGGERVVGAFAALTGL